MTYGNKTLCLGSDLWIFHMHDGSTMRLIMVGGLSDSQAMAHAGQREHDVERVECERGRV